MVIVANETLHCTSCMSNNLREVADNRVHCDSCGKEFKPFLSRLSGPKCARCSQSIQLGQQIQWARKGGKGVSHVICPRNEEAPRHEEAPREEAPTPEVIELDEVFENEDEEAPKPITKPKHNNGADDSALDVLARALETRLDLKSFNAEAVAKQIEQRFAELEAKLDGASTTIRLEVKNGDKAPIVVENAHFQLALLVKYLSKRKHVYLHGAPGGGKSHNVKLAAEQLGLRFGYISLDEQSPDYLLTGYKDANGVFQSTEFLDFYENGGVYCLEELDNASGSLLTALNVALENGHLGLSHKTIKRHADFILVGCGNTAGRGAHPAFPERRPFDAAFAARFQYIQWLYDWTQAEKIAKSINASSKPVVSWTRKASEFAESNGIRVVLSPREAFAIADLLDAEIETKQLLAGILRGLDNASVEKIMSNFPFPEITLA
jgi:hypothetical protein